MSFTCEVCWVEKDNSEKMAEEALGCGCPHLICIPCFLQDMDSRKVAIWMNEIGICIMEPLELDRTLIEEFKYYHPELQDNTNEEVYDHPAYQEFLLDITILGSDAHFATKRVSGPSTMFQSS